MHPYLTENHIFNAYVWVNDGSMDMNFSKTFHEGGGGGELTKENFKLLQYFFLMLKVNQEIRKERLFK